MQSATRLAQCSTLAASAFLTLSSCGPAQSTPRSGLLAVASIAPLATFTQRIGGAHVTVETLIGPGQSPHAFAPTPQQVASIARAQVYFSIGVGQEPALRAKLAANNSTLRIVDTLDGVPLLAGDEHEHHDDDAEHAAAPYDPHAWLDPARAVQIAENIAGGLIAADPGNETDYRQNMGKLAADLRKLNDELRELLLPFNGRAFLVFHPAYAYFARAYGLRQIGIEVDGKEPTPQQLGELVTQARDANIRAIFYQPQSDERLARQVAAQIDAQAVAWDPLAADYFSNLRTAAENLAQSFASEQP